MGYPRMNMKKVPKWNMPLPRTDESQPVSHSAVLCERAADLIPKSGALKMFQINKWSIFCIFTAESAGFVSQTSDSGLIIMVEQLQWRVSHDAIYSFAVSICRSNSYKLWEQYIYIYYIYIQWGKKVFSQPPIVQVLPLKKMREACNFHHRYTSTMRDKIRKNIQKITL